MIKRALLFLFIGFGTCFGQVSVQKSATGSTGTLSNGGFHVPSGQTVTIDSGATIANNGTATGFSSGTSFVPAAPLVLNTGTLSLAYGSGLTLNTGTLVPSYGSSANTIAQGNDTRFPASVTGIRLGAGAGSADTALALGSGLSLTTGTLTATGSGGTVTSIVAGSGLSGGTITGTGTVSLNLNSANTWTAAQTGAWLGTVNGVTLSSTGSGTTVLLGSGSYGAPFALSTAGSGAATYSNGTLDIPTPGAAFITALTTTGSSGAATVSSGTLNVPQYAAGVLSFNTRTGAITLTSSDLSGAGGLLSTNNLSDVSSYSESAANLGVPGLLGVSNHKLIFAGDSITMGPHDDYTLAPQSFAAVVSSLGPGAGGMTVYDFGFPQETTGQIAGAFAGNGTATLTTATYTASSSTMTLGYSPTSGATLAVSATGIPDNTIFIGNGTASVVLLNGSTRLPITPTVAGTGASALVAYPPADLLTNSWAPGGTGQNWSGIANSIQQLSYNYNGSVPTDVFLLCGANDLYDGDANTTVTLTNGSPTGTVTSASGISNGQTMVIDQGGVGVPGFGIVSTNTLTISGLVITLNANFTGTTGTYNAEFASPANIVTVSTTMGSNVATVASGTDPANTLVLTGSNGLFASTAPPSIVSGGGTTSLTLSANATTTGSTVVQVHSPVTSIASWQSAWSAFVTLLHGAGDTVANGGGVTALKLIPNFNYPGQGSPVSNVFRGQMNVLLSAKSSGTYTMGQDFLIDTSSPMPVWAYPMPSYAAPFYWTDQLHPSVLGDGTLGSAITRQLFTNEPNLVAGSWTPPGVMNLNMGNTEWVSSTGDDQKGIGEKYSLIHPFKTLVAAYAVANPSGTWTGTGINVQPDNIYVLGSGAVTIPAMTIKNGVSITLGAGVSSGTMTGNPAITDGGNTGTLVISGCGQTIYYADAFSTFLTLTGTNSYVNFNNVNLEPTNASNLIQNYGNGSTVIVNGNIIDAASGDQPVHIYGPNTVTVTGTITTASNNGQIICLDNGSGTQTFSAGGIVSTNTGGTVLYCNGYATVNVGTLVAAGQAMEANFHNQNVTIGALTEGVTPSSLIHGSWSINATVNSPVENSTVAFTGTTGTLVINESWWNPSEKKTWFSFNNYTGTQTFAYHDPYTITPNVSTITGLSGASVTTNTTGTITVVGSSTTGVGSTQGY